MIFDNNFVCTVTGKSYFIRGYLFIDSIVRNLIWKQKARDVILPDILIVSVIKLQSYNLQLCENRGSGTGVLLRILLNFSEQFYAEQL